MSATLTNMFTFDQPHSVLLTCGFLRLNKPMFFQLGCILL